jgi:pre-mRNA-processing factor 6
LKVDPISGVKSSIGGNMSLLGDARRTILGLSLDQASAGANIQSRIDKSGYITALDSANKAFADLDIHDLHKARLLFKSMVESNPQDAKGWQGAARIEEMDGKVDEARNIIAQGIEECPDNEDVWSEAIRLAEYNSKKDLSVRAIKGCPKSIKLWIIAARLETETDRKVKVLKKGLQMVPQSEKLWRELIDLSSGDEEAKEFLKSAVECVPVGS